jgi:hypothetical protein
MSLKSKILKTTYARTNLPRDLGDGLVLRYATGADAAGDPVPGRLGVGEEGVTYQESVSLEETGSLSFHYKQSRYEFEKIAKELLHWGRKCCILFLYCIVVKYYESISVGRG